MTKYINYPLAFIDIGSTIIKIHIHKGAYIHRYFEPRNYDLIVGDQVENIINKIKEEEPKSRIRICSSANGGLRVGIISMTSRYSGEAAKRIALASGCNVMWLKSGTINQFTQSDIDVLIIAGGLDITDSYRHEEWMYAISNQITDSLPVIFAGNKKLGFI